MSDDEQSGAGRREMAYRVFAAEFDDATLEYSESDEERAPNYVVTPSGARINRLFVVGVLTEVERVNENVLRARVVDPTGAFVVYAGQYQPDEMAFLERADPPSFVALTGKARTFQPDGSDRIFTSVRPESINEVDADTRDRWVVQAAERTLARVATFASALRSGLTGDDLRTALREGGVDAGLAAGVPLAMDHYGTSAAYLEALRNLSLEALAVVADERDEVEPLGVAPGEERAGVDLDPLIAAAPDAPEIEAAPAGDDRAGATATAGETTDATGGSEAATADAGGDDATASASADDAAGDDLGDFERPDGTDDAGEATTATDEMYELDDEERERLESEYGTEFSTGTEVAEADEAAEGADADGAATEEVTAETGPETETDDERAETESATEGGAETGAVEAESTDTEPADTEPAETETATSQDDADGTADATATADEESGDSVDVEEFTGGESEDDAVEDGTDEDADLDEVLLSSMRDLDDGDGADRSALIEAVADRTGAGPEEVESAIEDALMSGRCYEAGDDALKPI